MVIPLSDAVDLLTTESPCIEYGIILGESRMSVSSQFAPSSEIEMEMHSIVMDTASSFTDSAIRQSGGNYINAEIMVLFAWACSPVALAYRHSGLISDDEMTAFVEKEVSLVLDHVIKVPRQRGIFVGRTAPEYDIVRAEFLKIVDIVMGLVEKKLDVLSTEENTSTLDCVKDFFSTYYHTLVSPKHRQMAVHNIGVHAASCYSEALSLALSGCKNRLP